MQLSIHFGNLEPAASVRDDVAELIRSAVDKFDSRIRRISVSIRDVNGPKGGEDKQCRCVVHLKRMRPIVIQDAGENYRKLVNQVADRVSYTLSQRMDRISTRRRAGKKPGKNQGRGLELIRESA
jgi:ribosome-associated translation inhibitor RaiA